MITPAQVGILRDAIEDAFTLQALGQCIYIRLGKNIENYAPGSGIRNQAFALVREAEMEGWVDELVLALTAERPKRKLLLNIAYDLNIGFDVYAGSVQSRLSRSGLQNLVNADPVVNPEELISGIIKNKRCVCRIEIKKGGASVFGTGFLVGPDLLLSNYHVFEDVIGQPGLAAGVKCRFDYEVNADGRTINPGVEIGLADNAPVLASSPYSEYDDRRSDAIADIDAVSWPEDKMDYALVRLAREIGNEPFGLNYENAASEQRGWVKPATPAPALYRSSHMLIIQHPDKQPVKIAFGYSKILGCDHNGMRVRYDINTMPGSSGSPCFDEKFNWSALHNMGDPSRVPRFNQGIPAGKIVSDLAAKGFELK